MKRDRDNPFIGDFEPEHMMELMEGLSWHEFSRPDLSFVYRNLLRSFLSSEELKLDFRKFMEYMFDYFPERMDEHQDRFDLDGFKRSVIMEGYFEDKLPSVYPAHFEEFEDKLYLRHRNSSREEEIRYYFRLPHTLSKLDLQECVDLVNFLQVCNSYMLLVISDDPAKIEPQDFVLGSILSVFVLRRHWGSFHLAKYRDDDLDALFMVLLTPMYRLAEMSGEKLVLDLCLFFRMAVDSIVFGKVNIDQAQAFVSLIDGFDDLDRGEDLLDAALKLLQIEGGLPPATADLRRNSFSLDNFNQVIITDHFIPPPYLYLDAIYLGSVGGKHFYFCTETFTLRHIWSVSEQVGMGSVKLTDRNGKALPNPLGFLHFDSLDFLRANLNQFRIPFPDPFRTLCVSVPSDLDLSSEIDFAAAIELKGYRFYLISLGTVHELGQVHDLIRKTPGADLTFV